MVREGFSKEVAFKLGLNEDLELRKQKPRQREQQTSVAGRNSGKLWGFGSQSPLTRWKQEEEPLDLRQGSRVSKRVAVQGHWVITSVA